MVQIQLYRYGLFYRSLIPSIRTSATSMRHITKITSHSRSTAGKTKLLASCFLFTLLVTCVSGSRSDAEETRRRVENEFIFRSYPDAIEAFPIRTNPYINDHEKVSRGRFDLIGGLPNSYRASRDPSRKRYPLKEVKEALQCIPSEPSLDELYGTLSLMLLSPPTRELLELIAAWAETKCADSSSNWTKCARDVAELKAGKFPEKILFGVGGQNEPVHLLRIMNGELYMDWPWGVERFQDKPGKEMFHHLAMAVNLISDLPDSVFLFGGEQSYLPWTFPFAHISMAGSTGDIGRSTNTIIWPWEQEFRKEVNLYEHIQSRGNDFSPNHVRDATDTLEWDKKVNTKAAFYASYDNFRWVVMEQAARHPDLFEFSTNQLYQMVCWTPDCVTKWGYSPEEYAAFGTDEVINPTTSGVSLLHYSHEPTEHYKPGHFKYVVVPPGMAGMSTSSRLLYLLAHCECVVLLVSGNLQYHITPRLVPWVHYVPLASSGADVAAKVRWLQENDDLARQIAENGHNFGLSYLRLEDYVCYALNVVEALGVVMANTTALLPFNPIKLV